MMVVGGIAIIATSSRSRSLRFEIDLGPGPELDNFSIVIVDFYPFFTDQKKVKSVPT